MCSPGDQKQHPLSRKQKPGLLPFSFLTCRVLQPEVHSLACRASKINQVQGHTLPIQPGFPCPGSVNPLPSCQAGMLGFRFPGSEHVSSFLKRDFGFPDVCAPPCLPRLIIHPIECWLYLGVVLGCTAFEGTRLIFFYQLCRAPSLPFPSTSTGLLGCPSFLQPPSFPHRLSKIPSSCPGVYHYGNSWSR